MDLIVWNITSDEIRVRRVINIQDTWPKPEKERKLGTRGKFAPMSDHIKSGAITFPGIDEYPVVADL